jgi:hypothetical protein
MASYLPSHVTSDPPAICSRLKLYLDSINDVYDDPLALQRVWPCHGCRGLVPVCRPMRAAAIDGALKGAGRSRSTA